MVEKSDNVKDSSKLKFYTLLVHEELYARWRSQIPTRSESWRSLPRNGASHFRCPETIFCTFKKREAVTTNSSIFLLTTWSRFSFDFTCFPLSGLRRWKRFTKWNKWITIKINLQSKKKKYSVKHTPSDWLPVCYLQYYTVSIETLNSF